MDDAARRQSPSATRRASARSWLIAKARSEGGAVLARPNARLAAARTPMPARQRISDAHRPGDGTQPTSRSASSFGRLSATQ
jgi:hypothetical protein